MSGGCLLICLLYSGVFVGNNFQHARTHTRNGFSSTRCQSISQFSVARVLVGSPVVTTKILQRTDCTRSYFVFQLLCHRAIITRERLSHSRKMSNIILTNFCE